LLRSCPAGDKGGGQDRQEQEAVLQYRHRDANASN